MMTDNDMIIVALRESYKDRVSSLVDDYEYKIASLRLQLTKVSNKVETAERRAEQLVKENNELRNTPKDESSLVVSSDDLDDLHQEVEILREENGMLKEESHATDRYT